MAENHRPPPDIGEPLLRRLGKSGQLHGVIDVRDESGKIVDRIFQPLMLEFRLEDVFQIVIGAAALALPVAYSEEAWNLGESLPLANIVMIILLSLSFISLFVYFHFYRGHLRGYAVEYVKRTLGAYVISLVVVAVILTVIQQCPWGVDNALAFKRIIIVAFPAAMAGTVVDSIK